MDVPVIKQLCLDALKKINNQEKERRSQELTKCGEFLLNDRSSDNDDTVQFLLDPRRNWDAT